MSITTSEPGAPGASAATEAQLTGRAAVVGATVHGLTVGYWWAAGAFWAGAVLAGP